MLAVKFEEIIKLKCAVFLKVMSGPYMTRNKKVLVIYKKNLRKN